jgi:O-antigen ligase
MALPLLAILLTYSRSGWIALAAAVVVYIALYNYRLFPVFFVGGAFALPFIPQSIYERILTIGNLNDSSSSYRMDIWTGCFEMLKKYWFTGIGLGPGAFARVFPEYAVGETTVVRHSHMQFMEMMVEGGVLLFIAYIALVFGLIRRSCVAAGKAGDSEIKHFAVASCASIAGITLIGLFEYCWFYPRVMFAFFISAGLCLAISRMISDET